jgi:hypothetical protein
VVSPVFWGPPPPPTRDDAGRLERGAALFDGLYAALGGGR